MDYYRPAFTLNRPPLFQPRTEQFNFNYNPASAFHQPFALTTPSGISLFLQRPPQLPMHLPAMLPGAPYMHSHSQQHQSREPKRQRPSRRIRQRIKRQPERLQGEDESNEKNTELTPLASESGYDTTGDCHTPATPLDSPVLAHGHGSSLMEQATDSNKLVPSTQGGICLISDSASSMNLSEISLKKLLKDLHRCEVSLNKYQAMFDKNCEDGMVNLQEIFSRLRDHLNAREQSLIEKLSSVKEMATSTLQRRKTTASFLRQAAESSQTTLEESQILELKHQIKCFVTDRKVDEEIGTNQCFQADPDDLVRHIMGFGKVSEARHVYTVWEENPAEMINISKEQVLFPRIRNDDDSLASRDTQQPSRPLESETKLSDSDRESASNSTNTEDHQADYSTESSSNSPTCDITEMSESGDLLAQSKTQLSPRSPLDPVIDLPIQSSLELSPLSSPAKQQSGSAESATMTLSTDRQAYSYRVSATSSIKHSPRSISMKSGRPWHMASKVTIKRAPSFPKQKDPVRTAIKVSSTSDTVKGNKKFVTEKEKVEKLKESSDSSDGPSKDEHKKEKTDQNHRPKYSNSELQTIQLRVKESLQQQGVYLYDPVTGDGPTPTAAAVSPSAGEGATGLSNSPFDACAEEGSKASDTSTAFRKKKTPTQLRRERKKRQKERERRQRELEKKQELEVRVTKDLETEMKGEREDESKQHNQYEQLSSRPSNNAIVDCSCIQENTQLAKLLSSDSEPNPESQPTHSSSSSLTKSVDNEEELREGLESQNQQEIHEESKETETSPTAMISVLGKQVSTKGNFEGGKPSMVMLTEEARAGVKINQQASCQVTLTTTQDAVHTG